MTTNTTSVGWQAIAAVETARIGSASLSASYYAMLGLAVPALPVGGVAIPAAAIGLGALAASLDYIKGSLLSVGLGGRGHGVLRRITALALGAVLFVASGVAIDGVILKLRATGSAGPADVIKRHDDAAGDLKAAKDELETLASVRTTDQVRADMDRTKIGRNTWRDTAECTNFTGDLAAYRKGCQPMLDLRVEMADAIRKGNLEAKRDELQDKLDGLGPRPVAADPQATAIAAVTGVSENFVLLVLAGILGFAIELVSCFGRYAIDRPAPSAPDVPAERPAVDSAGQSDYPAMADHPALFSNHPNVPPERPDGGVKVPAVPKRPAPSAPEVPADHPETETARRKADVLAFIRSETRISGLIESQSYLAQATGTPDATLSDWLAEWEQAGLIVRRMDGRRKVIAAPECEMAVA
jgi:hypothetical protein